MGKIHKLILLLIAIWMILTNFVSWKTTFLASSNIESTMLVRAVDDIFDSTLLTSYRLKNRLKKEDFIHRLTIRKGEALLTIPLDTKSVHSAIDMVSPVLDGLLISGWVFIPSKIETVQFVVAMLGESIVGAGEVDKLRSDVAVSLGEKRAVLSGFSFSIPDITDSHKCDLKIFALTQTMHLYQIPFNCVVTNTEKGGRPFLK